MRKIEWKSIPVRYKYIVMESSRGEFNGVDMWYLGPYKIKKIPIEEIENMNFRDYPFENYKTIEGKVGDVFLIRADECPSTAFYYIFSSVENICLYPLCRLYGKAQES